MSPGFELAGSFPSARLMRDELERLARTGVRPDWSMVLMDLDLPGTSGIEATRQIKRDLPHLPVVILTVFEEPATILEAITAGADGYLVKRTPVRDLLSQLRAIASGGAPLTPGVARTILSFIRNGSRSPAGSGEPAHLDLTAREQEVLRLLVQGLAYKDVAQSLGISLDTARSHVRAIYSKLQVHGVAAAVARAIRDKLV